jgi:hypothetical protein
MTPPCFASLPLLLDDGNTEVSRFDVNPAGVPTCRVFGRTPPPDATASTARSGLITTAFSIGGNLVAVSTYFHAAPAAMVRFGLIGKP